MYRGDEIPGDLTQIVREGQAAPNGGGLVFSNNFFTSDVPVLNNRGQVAFFGTVSGPSNNLGIFLGSGTAASLSNIVQVGQTAPDGNGRFTGLLSVSEFPPINDAGLVAFYSQITGATNGNQNAGIFLGNGATGTQIARTGYPGPFGNFAGLSDPVLNNLGQVAFEAITTGNTNGYFRSDGSTLTRIAWALENTSTSEPAPDVNGGINGTLNSFAAFQPSLNDAGQVAFITAFYATTNTPTPSSAGIVRGDGTPLVAIARTDELTPDGVDTLYAFWVNNVSHGAALNNSGQVAFAATLLPGGTTYGIFRGGGTVASLT